MGVHGDDKDPRDLDHTQADHQPGITRLVILHAFGGQERGQQEHQIVDDGSADQNGVVVILHIGFIDTDKEQHVKQDGQQRQAR